MLFRRHLKENISGNDADKALAQVKTAIGSKGVGFDNENDESRKEIT